MELADKIVLITGSARIGGTVIRYLADRGCHFAITYRQSKKNAEESADYARSKGSKVTLIKADLTLKENLADTIPKVKSSFGRLDVLINMASVYERRASKALSLEDFDSAIETNLKHVYWLSLKAAQLMKQSGGGRIINFSDWTSASGRPRYKNFIPYYTAKAGVDGLTQALALGLAPEILVNSIAPGPILKPAGMSPKDNKEVIGSTPLGRWGGGDEIAKTVIFLIETEFVTGECIRVDGGRHLT